MPTIVVNKYKIEPEEDDVYIGRGSKWGNPFIIGKDGNRADVISSYATYLLKKPDLLDSLEELQGKRLVCFCKPQACHGDILKIACENIEATKEYAKRRYG